jgi:hypothetical protein
MKRVLMYLRKSSVDLDSESRGEDITLAKEKPTKAFLFNTKKNIRSLPKCNMSIIYYPTLETWVSDK